VPRIGSVTPRLAAATQSWPATAVTLCAALIALRLLTLFISPLELGPDEAQYWRWSKNLDWGYFSKPPLIAWMIAGTTRAFGDLEWAVRLSAPLAHAVCAYFVARSASNLAGQNAGAPAALLYLSAPGVAVSSFIISTDAFLLAASAAALAACLSLRLRKTSLAHLVLGAAIGIGLLAKYAMIYAVLGILLATLWDRELRNAFMNWRAALSVGLAILIIAPNLYWNATHSFATFQHTAANADLATSRFDPKELGEFIGAQFGVFGPLAFALLPFALFVWRPQPMANAAQDASSAHAAAPRIALFAAFILLPLAAISVEALLNRANANWAAIAYPAASALVAAWCVRMKRPRLLFAAIAINLVLSLLVIVGSAAPQLADKAGAANSIKRTRGWDDITRSIAQAAAMGGDPADERFKAVAFDNRLIFHEVDYYGRTRLLPPLRMWKRGEAPVNHAQASAPLTPGSGPFLFVLSSPGNRVIVSNDFAKFEPRGSATVFLGGGKTRHVDFYIAEGYAPTPRDAAYEKQWANYGQDKSD
jgi:4-amino-4-deoxy-L-arabinose transferase-like glycosyltransferase